MLNAKRFDTDPQQLPHSTWHKILVAASTMLRPIAAAFLLVMGSAAFADDDVVQKEVIAATAAWAEAFNARDAQGIASLYANDAV